MEIGCLQFLHFPFNNKNPSKGILYQNEIGFLHEGQKEAGLTIEIFKGSL